MHRDISAGNLLIYEYINEDGKVERRGLLNDWELCKRITTCRARQLEHTVNHLFSRTSGSVILISFRKPGNSCPHEPYQGGTRASRMTSNPSSTCFCGMLFDGYRIIARVSADSCRRSSMAYHSTMVNRIVELTSSSRCKTAPYIPATTYGARGRS